jgi:hypothetical protein
MSHESLELTDEQREQVREMLAKFSTKKSTQVQTLQTRDWTQPDPDPLETAPPGSTVEWHELTPKTRRYTFVRDTRALFVPYILDGIRTSKNEIRQLVESIGLDITSQNESLTVCAATQADPVRIFQLQTAPRGHELILETIRYVM